ncbi:MAG: type II toxin-antitoxin system HicA family toxin [Candidatus Diapherotrites archaeon]|uniref:Type II toxin-antitoxin system HicA family toxin n=1 Tax=Candidatus Iainarchaeum sp. TaxID=3101447 RepID=A0A8T4L7L0_9ARCH|nr:type II toxin-antitoxin system HicA family toxin [Candidatus Diapherotrites archaeon]
MTGLRPLDQSRVIRMLEQNGFKQARSGKHITFKKTDADGNVLTTWVPHHKTVTVFVIKYIIKQTGKQKQEFY